MHEIRDTGESDSDLDIESEDRDVAEFDSQSVWSEWSKDNGLNDFNKIKVANSKIQLYAVLKSYKVYVYRNHNNKKWSELIQCPFPDHKDKTPSFGYNYYQNSFHCFGCNRSGKSVEFISAKENKSRIAVAESILDFYADADIIDEVIEEEQIDPRIEKLLLSMAESVRAAIKNANGNRKIIANIDKIIWWFDSYLTLKVGSKHMHRSSKIDVEELSARVDRVIELFEQII